MSGVKWTAEELETLRTYYPTEGPEVQRRIPRRSVAAVNLQASMLGLSMDAGLLKERERLRQKRDGDPLPHEIRERAEAIYQEVLAVSQGKDRLLRCGEYAS